MIKTLALQSDIRGESMFAWTMPPDQPSNIDAVMVKLVSPDGIVKEITHGDARTASMMWNKEPIYVGHWRLTRLQYGQWNHDEEKNENAVVVQAEWAYVFPKEAPTTGMELGDGHWYDNPEMLRGQLSTVFDEEGKIIEAEAMKEFRDLMWLADKHGDLLYHVTNGMMSKVTYLGDAEKQQADQARNDDINRGIEEHNQWLITKIAETCDQSVWGHVRDILAADGHKVDFE